MSSTRRIILATAVATATSAACATVVVKRPATAEAPRQDFIRRGEFTFAAPLLAGEGGTTCAGCHENHVPFEDYSLARKFYDLSKLVDNCLYERTKHVRTQFSDIEAKSLREFVVYNYVLKGVIQDEDPEGIRKLGEAMESFLSGDYDTALGEVRGARGLVKTSQNQVQSFALEGCIQLFKLNDGEAKAAFASALKLNPKVRIDGYVFSPKVLRILEDTRASLVSSDPEP